MSGNIQYINDTRYPGPKVHPATDKVGIPPLAELDAYPRLFTWGEIKDIIQKGDIDRLMRNREIQYKYDVWQKGVRTKYGSMENYLREALLPFPKTIRPTYDLTTSLDLSQPPSPISPATSAADSDGLEPVGSGVSTPSSTAFVSLEDSLVWNKNGNMKPVYLRLNDDGGLDQNIFAVLLNTWPYSVPTGVRHFCVWSRIPIAHPELVDYDPVSWQHIEEAGLSGFTGVLPVIPTSVPVELPNKADPSTTVQISMTGTPVGRGANQVSLPKAEWYLADRIYGGNELQRWTGVQHETKGGHEVGKIVRKLWDERGWECLWFLNPPRIQSVPGFSHFHVFVRRKTPEEIDAAEKAFAAGLI
ncbi:uncharacterized protein L203_102590 [Cryptococcus depauperatus CBS 7841]|uniref:Uncharacterized protein n=1 Tax=Cryptococcus depauperatus CBS 7841 TaxID=1295531 RepID=A0AAJ8JS49_9TREE